MNEQYKTEQQWRELLDAESYRILREKGTEPAFSGEYNECHEQGEYCCKACGEALFSSDTKYDSGSGWPSFYQPLAKDAVAEVFDDKYGMRRIEVVCKKCASHLGHVFEDGPAPTGQRFCINSASLRLKKQQS